MKVLIRFIRANGGVVALMHTSWHVLRNDGALALIRLIRHLLNRLGNKTSNLAAPEPFNLEDFKISNEPPNRQNTTIRYLNFDANQPQEFSVIIPCYGQSSFLFDALSSVASATVLAHEVIVIDDGNKKRSELMHLDQLAPAGPHQTVVIVKQDNLGLGSARNSGLLHARGNLVKFLDADDLLQPGALDLELAAMQRAEAHISIGAYALWNEEQGYFGVRNPFRRKELRADGEIRLTPLNLLEKWEEGLTIPIHSALFSREKLKPFSDGMESKEDFLFWLTLFSDNPKAIYLNKVVCIYRLHSRQMTLGSKLRNGAYLLEALYRFSEESRLHSSVLRAKIKYVRNFYGQDSAYIWAKTSIERSAWLQEIMERRD